MVRYISIVTLLLLITASCVDRGALRALDSVESYITEEPDRALSALDSLSQAGIKGKEANARYALLYSMALDKNFIDIDTDSIIAPAVKWYSRHGRLPDRMRTAYYLGRIRYNAQDFGSAIVCQMKAGEMSAELGDLFYQGMSSVAMADIYASTYNSMESLCYSRKAYGHFIESGNEEYAMMAMLGAGLSLNNLGKYSDARAAFDSVYVYSVEHKDSVLYSNSMLRLAHLETTAPDGNPARAVELYSRARASGAVLSYGDWCSLVSALHLSGNRAAALSLMHQLEAADTSGTHIGQLKSLRYRLFKSDGDYQSAIEALEDAVEYEDSLFNIMLEQSAVKSQRVYYEHSAEDASRRADAEMLLICVILLSFIIIALVSYLTVKNKMVDKERDLSRFIGLAEESGRLLAEEKQKTTTLMQSFAVVYKARFEALRRLYSVYDKYSSIPDKEKYVLQHVKAMLSELDSDSASRRKFEKLLDKELDNAMTKLRQAMPRTRDEDFVLLGYLFAGLDAASVSLIMGIPVNNIYSRKNRLKERISKLDLPEKTFYLKLIS